MAATTTGEYRSRPRRPAGYPKPGQLAGQGGKSPPLSSWTAASPGEASDPPIPAGT